MTPGFWSWLAEALLGSGATATWDGKKKKPR